MFRLGSVSVNSPLILVLRNLRTRQVRTLLTLLGIVIGVAAMVSVNATNSSTLSSIDSFFNEASGQADLLVESAVAGEGFDQEILATIRRFPQVVAAAPGLVGVTVLANEADEWQQQFAAGGAIIPGTNFWLMGRDPSIDYQVQKHSLVKGRLLRPGEQEYHILLVDEYATAKGVEVGERLAVLTPQQGIVSFRVIGLIAKEGIGITNEGVIGVAPLSVVQELFGRSDELSSVELVVEESVATDSAALDDFRLQLQARLGRGVDVKYPAARGELVVSSLENYQRGLSFFGVVSLFVGSFLIYNAFAMTIVERTREIGLLRAIGATQKQIMGLVLAEAALLGVVGSVAGVGAGIALARVLVASVSGFTGHAIGQVTAAPNSLLQSAAVGLLVTLLAALIPAWQASRISPMKALHVQGRTDEGRWSVIGLKYGPLTLLFSWLVFYHVPLRPEIVFQVGSNTIFLFMLGATLCIPILAGPIESVLRPLIIFVFGNEGRLGSANVNRARGRTTLTVAALMVGISMVVGINGLTRSFEQDIQLWVDTALGADLFVRSPLRLRPEVESRLLALPEVTAVSRSRYIPSRMQLPSGDEYAVFVAIDPDTYLSVSSIRIQEGPDPKEAIRQLAEGNAILVGADVANKFNISLGDSVTLVTKRGQQDFRVVAIIIDFSGGETTTVTGSWRDLRRYFGTDDVSTFFVRLQPGSSRAAVTEKIEEEVGRGKNLSVESKEEFAEKVRDLSQQAFGLFDVLGLIGLAVASLGIINTMLMNVMERTRELGSLRSLGMDRRQIRRMILSEATAIGVIGGLFGMGFGAVLSDVFILGLQTLGGFVLTSRIPYQAMGYSFIIAMVVAIAAAWYPAVHASNLNIIEAIKHE